jgi:GNAT superfamily N-acetyltransferase
MIRDATLADAAAIAPLIGQLGYPATVDEIETRLAPLLTSGEPPLVWDEGGAALGVLVWHVTPNLHRAGPAGRIVALVVSETARGRGLGRALLAETEARCRALGCVMMEVGSNMRRDEAHRFYEGLGYERTSYKFAKDL